LGVMQVEVFFGDIGAEINYWSGHTSPC
jgi:hypothetical protein